LINWGDIEGRFDPQNLKFFLEIKNEYAYTLMKIKKILLKDPMYGANEAGKERTSEIQPRYIRITDIDDYGLLNSGMGATCENIEEKYLLDNNDLLIARSGNTVGKSYLHKSSGETVKYIFAGYMIKFVVNSNISLPDYVFYYLQTNFFKNWKNATMRVAGQPNINAQEYKDMLIPIPPLEIQQQIVNIMDKAYSEKQEKEKEANDLRASIDEYLLNELGIVLPEQEDNTLENRTFYTNASDILGGRFDPRKYSNKVKKIFAAVNNSPISKISLSQMITESVSGNWGFDEEEKDDSLIKCLTIRATEFDNRHNLKLDNSRVKYRKYPEYVFEKVRLSSNDILIEKSGGSEDQPVGRVAIIDTDVLKSTGEYLVFSNFIHKVRINDNIVLPEYLFEYLTLIHSIKITEAMQTQTNGIRNLIMKEYFNQVVLVPDINIQHSIVNTIKTMRNKAIALENQAIQSVENAKTEVEKVLLGGESL
jgi:restriction endonuclease S subunit